MTTARRGGLAALLLALFVAMATPAHAALISQEQEIAIGRQAAAQLESQYPLYTEIGMNERLNRIAERLLSVKERDLPYRFRILDVPDINAMALPGGFIYATRGLMESMSDEEAAFVLAHELQHIEKRHSIRAIERDLYTQIGLSAAIAIFSRGQISEGTANTIAIANTVLQNRYSQAMERESDREGIVMMARSGIDPQGAILALDTLQRLNQGGLPGFVNWFLGSHPLTADRIRAAEQTVAQIREETAAAVPQPEAEVELEVGIAPVVPEAAIPPLDLEREAELRAALESSRYAFVADPALMREARMFLANPPASDSVAEDHAVVVVLFSDASTEAQLRSQLVDWELPRTLDGRTFQNYGLAVGITPDGNRRLVLLLT